ncbi:MAG: SDR family NAD(P)-dependent oxidoreductase [Dehalococcoidales bacterium]|nr:SDR family NAD(P)-dependent oxidoreductase [Dehalococcoidales bacterium]
MALPLEGKVALVTGARQGLGKSISLGMAEQGADLVICDRVTDDGKLDETAKEIEALGRKTLTMGGDITIEEDVAKVVEEAIKKFGKIDVLVNNAGVTSQDSFDKMTYKRWRLILSVNLDGTFVCTKAVLPHMLERKSGMVINVSSILAKEIRMNIAYGVTKAAVERFTQGVGREVRREPGVAVTCVRPYFVKTEVVMGFMEGHDTSNFEDPIIWQKYPAMLAASKPEDVNGKIWDKAALEEKFGVIKV